MNDVSAAGYRYLHDPGEDFCIVTVSSGIGNKVFLRGHPMVGPGGRGGEIGHVQVDFSPDAPLCDCGALGHLGAIASGHGTLAMARRFAQRGPEAFARSRLGQRFAGHLDALENPDIVEAFHAEDAWTLNLIHHVARPLGQMLAAIHLGVGIERFVLIGGFALALGEPYRREVARAASSCEWGIGQDWQTMLELGAPDDHSGLIGAGRFAMESSRSIGT
jgi:predicted NBD/HSP70 family sugar kinase